MTPEERSSADNGIWLCQNCAKLIDSDAMAYSARKLFSWKIAAELEALRNIAGSDQGYFPQPMGAVHAPIPRIGGLPYDEARQLLFDAGWQPRLQHWTRGKEFDMTYGNGLYFWNKGFREIRNAMGTGLAHCDFALFDVYGNKLVVRTAGETPEDGEVRSLPGVWLWYFEKD